MTYRTNYELTTPTIPVWRRFGLWLNPQRWKFARKARGGHWVLYCNRHRVGTPVREWVRANRCTGYLLLGEAHPDRGTFYAIAHEDHGEVWG